MQMSGKRQVSSLRSHSREKILKEMDEIFKCDPTTSCLCFRNARDKHVLSERAVQSVTLLLVHKHFVRFASEGSIVWKAGKFQIKF